MKLFSRYRMDEGEGKGVESLTVYDVRDDFGIGFHAWPRGAVKRRSGISVDAAVLERVTVTVEVVSLDRMTYISEMNPYLVCSACFKLQLHQSIFLNLSSTLKWVTEG